MLTLGVAGVAAGLDHPDRRVALLGVGLVVRAARRPAQHSVVEHELRVTVSCRRRGEDGRERERGRGGGEMVVVAIENERDVSISVSMNGPIRWETMSATNGN